MVILVQIFAVHFFSILEEIIEYSGGPCHLSTILLKDFHLFKIAEPIINFCLKKISN